MNKYTDRNSSDKGVILIIGGISLVALVLIVFVAFGESKKNSQSSVASYQIGDSEKPQAKTGNIFADLGSMKTNDEKTVDFTIENTGDKPLQLFNITSSCNCTFGQITINNNKSPLFSMHSQGNWVGDLNIGEKATVTVIYRPYLMPVKGEITRSVTVQTNDPQNKELTFSVKAFVE